VPRVSTAEAIQAILGSTAVLLGLLVQSILARRFQRKQHEQTATKLDKVERTVNGNFDKATSRIEQLAAALTLHGIAVPPTPNGEES